MCLASALEKRDTTHVHYVRESDLGALRCNNVYQHSVNSSVVDLSCNHRFHHAIFHRLVDCAVRNFALFALAAADPGSKVVVPKENEMVANLVLGADWPRRRIHIEAGARNCVGLASGAAVNLELKHVGDNVSRIDMAENGRMMRAAIFARLNITPSYDNLLYIDRRGAREMTPNVLAGLKRLLPYYNITVYTGRESFADTVKLFSKAAVVFGFHGAGAANAMFGPDACLVVELTYCRDKSNDRCSRTWRSNKRVTRVLPSLRWMTYALDPGVAGVNSKKGAKDVDHVLKKHRVFNVSFDDLHNLATMISALDGERRRGATFRTQKVVSGAAGV